MLAELRLWFLSDKNKKIISLKIEIKELNILSI